MGRRAIAGALRVAWVAALGVLCGAARAAEPGGAVTTARPRLPLSWHAPAGCGTAPEVEARVLELLGAPEQLGGVAQVDAHVSETRSGWALHLVVRDALGTRDRRLEAERCHDLVEAAAIAVSLAVEAARESLAERDATPAASDATPEPKGSATAAHETGAGAASAGAARAHSIEPEPTRADEGDGSTIQAGAELVVDLNSLAAAAAGPSLFVALGWGAFTAAAQATWLPGANKSVGPEQAVEFSLFAGGARACYALARGLLDTAVCGGVDAGQLTARGAGLVESRVVHDPWLSAQAGLALSRELGAGLALQARGDVVVPLLRQGYAINETQAVHHVASIGARISVGLRASF